MPEGLWNPPAVAIGSLGLFNPENYTNTKGIGVDADTTVVNLGVVLPKVKL